jgi:hypothetical protein
MSKLIIVYYLLSAMLDRLFFYETNSKFKKMCDPIGNTKSICWYF